MRKRILDANGNWQTYVAPKKTKVETPVVVPEEVEEKPVVVKMDYTLMSAKDLKVEATKRGLSFKGNVSAAVLVEMLVENDRPSEDTDNL